MGVVAPFAVGVCSPPQYALDDVSVAVCDDGKTNGSETDVDCGGSDCQKCLNGDRCLASSDCVSGDCAGGVCAEPHCGNLTLDADEQEVDCGGADCTACATVDSCGNHQQDDNETGVDCGGPSICDRCGTGDGCQSGADCASGSCTNNICDGEPDGLNGASGAGGATGVGGGALGGTTGDGGTSTASGARPNAPGGSGATSGASAGTGAARGSGGAGDVIGTAQGPGGSASTTGAIGGAAGGLRAVGGAEEAAGMPGKDGDGVSASGQGGDGGAAQDGESERWVSDLCELDGAENGWGPFEKDQSNGETAARDGGPITIAGTVYDHGLGAHAPSDIGYAPNDSCSTFSAMVGIDDEVGDAGEVVFEVWGDGTLLYQSGVINGAGGATAVQVDVTGVEELHLVVSDYGTNSHDHADWADAKLVCTGEPIASCASGLIGDTAPEG